ncbi:MAG TPA: hypothetical protein VGK41_01290 [Solirubrobacterales bacterium]
MTSTTTTALRRAQRLFAEALPKFNWGASALDANAIQLLNEVPGEVAAALAEADKPGTIHLSVTLSPEWVDSVLCTAIESATYGWFDWTDIDAPRGGDYQLPIYRAATCTEHDPDEGTPVEGAQPVLVNAAKLAEGVQKILDGTVKLSSQHVRDLFQSVTRDDAGMVDADLADCIIQAAVLGELRYG